MSQTEAAPGFWRVVWLLLRAAYIRAAGRRRRQRQIFAARTAGKTNFAALGLIFVTLFLASLHGITALCLFGALQAGEQTEAERQGFMVAEPWFIHAVFRAESSVSLAPGENAADHVSPRAYRNEAARLAQPTGEDARTLEARLRGTVRTRGSTGFWPLRSAPGRPGAALRALAHDGRLAPMLGSLVLFVWFVMMAFQGEGLELDVQRRRHPMWEWLFSHPVPPGAVFLADMLAPVAANPIYLTAPILPGLVYGCLYGTAAGFLAAALAGVPLMLAAACLGKALEVLVILRFPPRSRGAIIGLMGWAGYVTMMALFLAFAGQQRVFLALAGALAGLAALPWPYLGWFLGLLPGGQFSLAFGFAVNLVFAACVIAISVRICLHGAARGLISNPGAAAPPAGNGAGRAVEFSGDALYRKEFLWLLRDRGALVQAILIPFSIAALQAFNLRRVIVQTGHDWNTLCGVAIVFGTYMLLVLGPKSLASEGAALWISLTWPQGLEKLLLAKARLWTLIATTVVGLGLIYAAVQYPANAVQIALLGVAWFIFARSIAARTVTLATVTSESGEIQKVPQGRRWAAQLGILTFAIGIFSRQWNLVVLGAVYSSLMAAAMWQNFRARLPYLYDPWSEILPPPPTLMHAMIGISALVECGAVITGFLLVFIPRGEVAIAHAVIYGTCAAIVSVSLAIFLQGRGVNLAGLWNWPAQGVSARTPWTIDAPGQTRLFPALLIGGGAGLLLGGFGQAYLALVHFVPDIAEQLRHSNELTTTIPHLRESLFVMAVAIAPFAEEFLFRGLLYRALDREWGGWKAVLGSAAFFAVYHPMLSWVPVFVLGATNAVLFKASGRLAPCVAVHMVYNVIVLI
jgi:membrane protease YdiL (CAAX protease family)